MTEVRVLLDVDENRSVIGTEDQIAERIEIRQGITFARKKRGTKDGRSTVFILVTLPDGRLVVFEMTYRNFEMASKILEVAEAKDRIHRQGKG
jgi:hypothetical protein